MEQLDMFGNNVDSLKQEIHELRSMVDTLRKGTFYRFGEIHKEIESISANCEVISDELFKIQIFS